MPNLRELAKLAEKLNLEALGEKQDDEFTAAEFRELVCDNKISLRGVRHHLQRALEKGLVTRRAVRIGNSRVFCYKPVSQDED